jgi:catechol 2,3-dioxygenase-like lactoylglutathione lyase family enzyme
VEPRITLITLGVDDLERAVGFYRDGLGLDTQGRASSAKSLSTAPSHSSICRRA